MNKFSCSFLIEIPDYSKIENQIKNLLNAFDITDFNIINKERLCVDVHFSSNSQFQIYRISEAFNAFARFHRILYLENDWF